MAWLSMVHYMLLSLLSLVFCSNDVVSLELKHLSLLLFLAAKLEMLASLDRHLILTLAVGALQPENDLFGGLCLLPEDRFRLTAISLLFAVVTAFPLGRQRVFTFLILRNLMQRVFSAFGGSAKGTTGLGDIHHFRSFRSTSLPESDALMKTV